MKVRALHKFEGLLDLERTEREKKDVYPKAGDVWETSEERALYLKNNGVAEIVEEDLPKVTPEKIIESAKDDKEFVEPIKSNKKKKTSKK